MTPRHDDGVFQHAQRSRLAANGVERAERPGGLKECLPGCESFERGADGAYMVVMAARVGPVSARFTGRMTMTDIDAPRSYTLHFDGHGGAADAVLRLVRTDGRDGHGAVGRHL